MQIENLIDNIRDGDRLLLTTMCLCHLNQTCLVLRYSTIYVFTKNVNHRSVNSHLITNLATFPDLQTHLILEGF